MRKGRVGIRRHNVHNAQAALEESMSATPDLESRRQRQGTKMGKWLNVLPSTLNGMEMGDQERPGALFLCYGIDPQDLPPHCDI